MRSVNHHAAPEVEPDVARVAAVTGTPEEHEVTRLRFTGGDVRGGSPLRAGVVREALAAVGPGPHGETGAVEGVGTGRGPHVGGAHLAHGGVDRVLRTAADGGGRARRCRRCGCGGPCGSRRPGAWLRRRRSAAAAGAAAAAACAASALRVCSAETSVATSPSSLLLIDCCSSTAPWASSSERVELRVASLEAVRAPTAAPRPLAAP